MRQQSDLLIYFSGHGVAQSNHFVSSFASVAKSYLSALQQGMAAVFALFAAGTNKWQCLCLARLSLLYHVFDLNEVQIKFAHGLNTHWCPIWVDLLLGGGLNICQKKKKSHNAC